MDEFTGPKMVQAADGSEYPSLGYMIWLEARVARLTEDLVSYKTSNATLRKQVETLSVNESRRSRLLRSYMNDSVPYPDEDERR